jgi:hypothetical protein
MLKSSYIKGPFGQQCPIKVRHVDGFCFILKQKRPHVYVDYQGCLVGPMVNSLTFVSSG